MDLRESSNLAKILVQNASQVTKQKSVVKIWKNQTSGKHLAVQRDLYHYYDPPLVPSDPMPERGEPYVQVAPPALIDRLQRARTELMQLETWGMDSRVFEIRGSRAVYRVSLSSCRPQCTCQDFLHRGKTCKHILFVMVRVLQTPVDNPVLWQSVLLQSELDDLFRNAPSSLQVDFNPTGHLLCPSRLSDTVDESWKERENFGQSSLFKTIGERPLGSFVVSIDRRLPSGRITKSFTYFDSASSFFVRTARCDAKHFHEVIELCVWTKLYFDVEHYVQSDKDPSKITECIFVIKEALLQAFPQTKDRMDALDDVVLLCSSRFVGEGKFKHSYHIIFPMIRFHGTARMKEFVKAMYGDSRLKAFDSRGVAKSMIDAKVYNTNQSFRLIESSKIEDDGVAQVPLQYADKRKAVTMHDLLRTVLTYDDGDDCVRIESDPDSDGPVLTEHPFEPWPHGLSRYFDSTESSAFTWMQFNFGKDGQERLKVMRQHHQQSGYVHFLRVEWRRSLKRYLYAWTKDMEPKAREIHTALRELRGSDLKDFSLGSKINNWGESSWVKSGHLVNDPLLGNLSEAEIDALVLNSSENAEFAENAMAVVADATASGDDDEGPSGEKALMPENATAVVADATGSGDDDECPPSPILWTRWHTCFEDNRPGVTKPSSVRFPRPITCPAPITEDGGPALITEDGGPAPVTEDGGPAPITEDGGPACKSNKLQASILVKEKQPATNIVDLTSTARKEQGAVSTPIKERLLMKETPSSESGHSKRRKLSFGTQSLFKMSSFRKIPNLVRPSAEEWVSQKTDAIPSPSITSPEDVQDFYSHPTNVSITDWLKQPSDELPKDCGEWSCL